MSDVKMAHELFLPESDEGDIIGEEDIGGISVERTAPHKENAGVTFSPAQLPNPAALHTMFGGGSYTVKARNQARQIIKGGTRYYTFHGKPKPMDGSTPKEEAQNAAAPQYAYPPPQPAMDLAPLAAIVATSQQTLATMMQAMMTSNMETIKALVALRSAPAGDGQGEVSTLLDGYKLGLSSLDQLMKAKDEGRAEGQALAQGSGDDIGSTVKSIAEAAQAFGSMRSNKGTGPLVTLPTGKKKESTG